MLFASQRKCPYCLNIFTLNEKYNVLEDRFGESHWCEEHRGTVWGTDALELGWEKEDWEDYDGN
jgi:hypothetical protein